MATNVFIFFGKDGNRAAAMHNDGGRLPPELGPWHLGNPAVLDPDDSSYAEANEALRKQGYWLFKGGPENA